MEQTYRATILHVDDNDAMRYAVGHILRQNQFEVIEAANGEEALQLAMQNPDLILLDIVLPDINGIEVCRRLKSQPETALIPVVHLSAMARSADDQLLAISEGADGYLTYPVDSKTLIATINAFLRIKQAEAALLESEMRFKTALKNVPITVCNQDAELRYTWVYGSHPALNPSRLLGKTDSELFAPAEAARLSAIKRAVLSNGGAEKGEITLTFEGQSFIFDITVERLEKRNGRVSGIIVVLLDITERKRANEALLSLLEDERRIREELKESEERFRSLYENTVIGIYRTTPDGRILMANPALVKMLGYSSFAELAERNLNQEGFEPDYPRQEFQARIEREGKIQGIESAWKRRDGSVIFVRESARLVCDERGKPLYYEGTAEDITERCKAEQKVREQLEELQRWHAAMLGRETRVIELKKEVNELLAALGRPPKYPSAEEEQPLEPARP